ncbi:hypothetical protein GGS23DRAFT_572773 [Durotheca rogersii]|uniref:uncharacterized protein n=1 Tax=Durotheca rogersii TaxID=419775 RepID=UPI00221FCB70|nr:uncharacterized protein GGS23DRAFT_572773 [Durotheca rogersii]KAI5862114.1 hypothetical protein GGS23DRAFT_572773 [Durotheca rogersii]
MSRGGLCVCLSPCIMITILMMSKIFLSNCRSARFCQTNGIALKPTHALAGLAARSPYNGVGFVNGAPMPPPFPPLSTVPSTPGRRRRRSRQALVGALSSYANWPSRAGSTLTGDVSPASAEQYSSKQRRRPRPAGAA